MCDKLYDRCFTDTVVWEQSCNFGNDREDPARDDFSRVNRLGCQELFVELRQVLDFRSADAYDKIVRELDVVGINPRTFANASRNAVRHDLLKRASLPDQVFSQKLLPRHESVLSRRRRATSSRTSSERGHGGQ